MSLLCHLPEKMTRNVKLFFRERGWGTAMREGQPTEDTEAEELGSELI